MALLAYVNSSMLGQFASQGIVNITYTLSAVLSLVLVGIAPNIIRRIGNMKYVGFSLVGSTLLLYLISTHSGLSIVPFFIVYFALNSVILYGLDLFLEHYSLESKTGNIRGTYLALGNIGWVAAPIISSTVQASFGFSFVYITAAMAVFATFIVVFLGQRGFVDKIYRKSHFIDGLHILRKNKALRRLTLLNFLLQTYFVVMVIYSPVYLTSVIGFSWKTLGIILTVMLSPFVIFPYPVGKLADKVGEKRLMYLGLTLMTLATIVFASLGATSAIIYALVLFATRTGASILETMCDSAFFKRVTDADSAVISTYRTMMPVAYTVGPLIAGLIFALYSYKILFLIIGVVMALSISIVYRIKDSHK